MSEPRAAHLIEWQDAGGVAVVRFTKHLLREEHVIRVAFDQIEALLEAGRKQVVLDFTGIEAFASYAIGKLIRLNDRVKAADGRLVLCSLPALVEEILDIMNLRSRFTIAAEERLALESFV